MLKKKMDYCLQRGYEKAAAEQEELKIRVVRSGRRTVCLQIDEKHDITVRAPYRMPDSEIRRFVEEKSSWITKHIKQIKERQRNEELQPEERLTTEEIRKLAGEALKYIPQRTAYYAPLVKVSYGRITIRNQKSRWGSCSSKGNLNFNCLLMLMPPEVIDYVVVHELCHRLEMNHSERFWKEVERVLPDYKLRKKWLRENGDRIMRRMALPG